MSETPSQTPVKKEKKVVFVEDQKSNQKPEKSLWSSVEEWWQRNSNSVYVAVGTVAIIGGAVFLYDKYSTGTSGEVVENQ